jgi:hypothetical protein
MVVAGAEYEVNISLNTKTIEGQLKGLETRINKMRRSINGPLSALQRQANLEDRIKASRVISFRLGTQLNALEQKGVDVAKMRKQIKEATTNLDKKEIETARARNKLVGDFVREQNRGLRAGTKNQRMAAESIDALANAQDKRFRLMQRIDRLEEKGGKTAKLRRQMGRLTNEMSDRNFGTFKQITRTLSRQITLEESKLRTQKEQTAELDKQLAKSARLGGPRSPVGGARFIPGSPAQIAASARAGGPFSPIGGSVGIPGSPAQIAASARAGGAASPIRGSANLVGSPAYYEAQARAIAKLARQGGPADPIKGHPNLIGSPAYFDAQRKATERLARQGGAASPVRGNKDLVGSPAYFEEQQRVIDRAAKQGGARSPLRGSKDLAGSPAYFEHLDREISKLARKGGAASPIRGSKNLVGSPAYYEHQRKELERLARQGGPTSPIGGTEAMPGSPAAIAARRRRIGDVALGAGFPLLFGGGPGAVLGGALGGAAGGGLAAQIGLSAAGQQIDQLIGKAIELGQALNPAAFNLERVTEAAGFAGTETQNLLQKIERYGDKAKAAELATELLRARIGDDGVKALEAFGKQAVVLGNNLSVIFTTVLANIAKAVQPLLQSLSERLGKTAAVRRFQAQDPSTLTGLDKLAFDILDPQLGTKGKSPFKLFDRDKPIQFFGTTPFEQLRNRAKKLGLPEDVDLRKFATERATKAAPGFEMPVLDRIEFEAGRVELPKDRSARIKRENMIAASEQRIKNLQAEAEKTKEISLIRGRIAAAEEAGDKQLVERLRGEEKAAEIIRKKARLLSRIPKDLDEQQRLAEELAISDTIRAEQLANQEATQRRIAKVIRDEQLEAIKKQEELYKQLGDTVKDGLVDSIKAAIDDTRTLGDALASMLRRLSDQFLQLAANMAFYGNAQGTLRNAQGQRTGGGIFGSLISALLPIPGASAVTSGFSLGSPDVGNIFNVQTPKTAGINFFANGGNPPVGRPSIVGERGPELFVPRTAGTIIPNHAMGSANVTVNVDASGSSVQGDGPSAQQLGKAIGAAVQAELIKQKRPGGLLTR